MRNNREGEVPRC